MTPSQTLLLWRILGRRGQVLQKDIGVTVKAADRKALIDGGYVSREAAMRKPICLLVEDKGWHWAGQHLEDPLSKNQRVLHDWLTLLNRHLGRTGQNLADFMGPTIERQPQASAEVLRARIEKAYLIVTGGQKAESVPLAKVRSELADLDRSVVDTALLRIVQGDKEGDGKARLGRIGDQKALTQGDRDAAFSPAGEPFHLLWIKS